MFRNNKKTVALIKTLDGVIFGIDEKPDYAGLFSNKGGTVDSFSK